MTEFAQVIQGLSGDDPRGNITAIKGAVKEQLQESDERVHIDLTDHFNHHYVPDIVLSWPGSSEQRRVYLRTSYREDDLARDIATLGEDRPILLSLARLPEEEPPGEALAIEASRTNSLVADPYGLEVLDQEAEAQPVVSLLSQALLRGGRGVMSTVAARDTGTRLSDGFVGAQEGDAPTTSAAVDAAAALLDSHRASQINRLLHAVWLGSGRPASTFPGAPGITAVLDVDSLRFILDLPDIEDEEFWGRIGSGLTTGRLCELQSHPASENLQRLLRRNARLLTAKACRVIARERRVDAPEWSVGNSNLVLRFGSEAIYFAPSALDQLPAASGRAAAVSVEQLQARARGAELRLGEVRLSNGSHVISYGTEDDADIAQADALVDLEAALTGATLTGATALSGSKELRCAFDTRTVRGNGPAKFYVSDLTRVAMPLLVDPTAEDAAAVDALFAGGLHES